jgi:hypothetical protein
LNPSCDSAAPASSLQREAVLVHAEARADLAQAQYATTAPTQQTPVPASAMHRALRFGLIGARMSVGAVRDAAMP